jgi:ribonuclease BN (tRNA processing enzyme)
MQRPEPQRPLCKKPKFAPLCGMQLTFIGSGDAFGTGGRFNTCFKADHAAGAFLIDFGATSMVALRQRGVDPNSIDAIFITHLHGDHFAGLPFFLLDARYVSRRQHPLTIVGPPGLAARLHALSEAMYPGLADKPITFDLDLRELAPGASLQVDAVTVAAIEMNHDSGAPSLGLRFAVDGRTLAYTGDTGWTDAINALGREADLFIMECTSYSPETDAHLSYETIRDRLSAIGARRIVLTHFGPDMMTRRHLANFELAEDGRVLDV